MFFEAKKTIYFNNFNPWSLSIFQNGFVTVCLFFSLLVKGYCRGEVAKNHLQIYVRILADHEPWSSRCWNDSCDGRHPSSDLPTACCWIREAPQDSTNSAGQFWDFLFKKNQAQTISLDQSCEGYEIIFQKKENGLCGLSLHCVLIYIYIYPRSLKT